MIEVLPPAKELKLILKKQKYDRTETLRFFAFCVRVDIDEGQLLFNVLTKELIFLQYNESDESDETRRYLVEHYFLVPLDHDDCRLANEVRDIILIRQKRYLNIAKNTFTILTTTDCNARCFYCYEHGIRPESMTDETAVNVIDYIDRSSNGDKIRITWFGGEPLYHQEAIRVICNNLKKRGIQFVTTMITNGFLFDESLVDEAVSCWHLNAVQITLDGTEKVYNKRKAYINPGDNPFLRVLKNIDKLLAIGIKDYVRLNMDVDNEQDLYVLCEQLRNRYGKNKNLLICPRILSFFSIPPELAEDMDHRIAALESYIDEYLNLSTITLERKVQTHQCMADSNHMVVILPDGSLHSCDHIVNGTPWGHINTERVDQAAYAFFRKQRLPEEACKTCVYYPNCFRLECCPSFSGKCTDIVRNSYIRAYKRAIKKQWNIFLEKKVAKNTDEQICNCGSEN